MMNIFQIENHCNFNKIFEKNRKENGEIDWFKISKSTDLPIQFIDKYFLKLKSYNIEARQKLDDTIIIKYANIINWQTLLSFNEIHEDIIKKCIDTIIARNALIFVIKKQNVSLDFLKSNSKYFKDSKTLMEGLQYNPLINNVIKKEFQDFLDSL